MQLSVAAQAEFLEQRAGCDTEQQQPKNPNEGVGEQISSSLPTISAKQRLDASIVCATTQLFRCLKTRIGAIADGTPCQIISRQAKARKFVQSFANFVHSARVAHIVLRQSARKSPHRAFNW